MEAVKMDDIRNVALISHSGAGKSTLCEGLLFKAGAISRRGNAEEGNLTSDFEPEEIKRRMSINLSLLPLTWKGKKINLIDTPGYFDFAGEVLSALRVVEGAVVVVCAAYGVEVGTEHVWKYADDEKLPRIIFVNRIDRENANFFEVLRQLEETFGKGCIPIQIPVGMQADFRGTAGLLSGFFGEIPLEELPSDLKEEAEKYRERLIEAIVETSDELMEKYLEGEEIPPEELLKALRRGVRERKIFPVMVGSSFHEGSLAALLEAICELLPSPRERNRIKGTDPQTGEEVEIEASEEGPLVAFLFKNLADPYVGKMSYIRVFSGSLQSNSTVLNATKGKTERFGQLLTVRGKNQQPVPQLVAGDIGAVTKLAESTTGDTFSSPDKPIVLKPIEFPTPLFAMAIYPKTKADFDRLSTALSRILDEDPSLKVRREPETGETLLCGFAQSHLEVAVEKMQRKFGVNTELRPQKIPYKETIRVSNVAEHKHKKQTGGRGQYGHVFLNFEPLPRGSGIEFTERIVGGVIPKNFIPAVEKGVREALQEGVLAGYPATDIRITLFDGSTHPVDSSDESFRIAGFQAAKKGLQQGQPYLLEPIMTIRVKVPEHLTGDVIGDLNSKRGRILGMHPEDKMNVIEAQVPLAELRSYANDLRALTGGRGSFTMEFSHYEEVPPHIAQQIIEEAKREKGRG